MKIKDGKKEEEYLSGIF